MKTSRSTGYALLAVGFIAKNRDKGIILSQDIAKKHKIPLEYLLKILQQLVRSNVLKSKRGPRGGFSLAMTPKKISMLNIIEAVDGPFACQLDLSDFAKREKFVVNTEKAYGKSLTQAKTALNKVKLSDLI